MTDIEIPRGQAAIRAIKFWNEFRPDANGDLQAEPWVAYCTPGNATYTVVEDAVRRVKRDKSGKWESIAGAYDAWVKGEEIPTDGTPLAVWAGVDAARAEVLKANGIRTVEEVSEMSETQMLRLRLPTPRTLKEQAARFLEARASSSIEQAIKSRDDEIATLKAQMESLMGSFADDEAPRNKGGRPRKEQPQAAA